MDAPKPAIHYPFDAPPAEGAAIEVAPGILWMRLPLPMKLDHVNIYALDDGDAWTIIDTGFASDRSRAIWQALLAGPLQGRPVRRVIATHHHPDHIGLAGWFQTAHGADLVTTRTAWLMARMLQLDEQDRPPPETLAFWRSAGMNAGILSTRMTERPFNFLRCRCAVAFGLLPHRRGKPDRRRRPRLDRADRERPCARACHALVRRR